MFLTHAEFSLIVEGMGERYKAFTHFLVMTGTRFGEATALTVADVDLLSKPPTARRSACRRGSGPPRRAFRLPGQVRARLPCSLPLCRGTTTCASRGPAHRIRSYCPHPLHRALQCFLLRLTPLMLFDPGAPHPSDTSDHALQAAAGNRK
jgi:hypothetical protein